MPDWDNHIMRKFGGSIRKKIAEAHDPFVKGVTIVAAHKTKEKMDENKTTGLMDYVEDQLK